MLSVGSRAGVGALARGDAVAAATHWIDDASGEYNVPLVREILAGADVVVLEWAKRTQGFLVREGNPLRIRKVTDLARKRLRIARRQPRRRANRRGADHTVDARRRASPAQDAQSHLYFIHHRPLTQRGALTRVAGRSLVGAGSAAGR